MYYGASMNIAGIPLQHIARVAMMIGFAVMAASGALAQTLTEPGRPANASPPASTSSAKTPMKSCPQYGAGFVQLPGSDTCVKIGGFVDGQVSGSRH